MERKKKDSISSPTHRTKEKGEGKGEGGESQYPSDDAASDCLSAFTKEREKKEREVVPFHVPRILDMERGEKGKGKLFQITRTFSVTTLRVVRRLLPVTKTKEKKRGEKKKKVYSKDTSLIWPKRRWLISRVWEEGEGGREEKKKVVLNSVRGTTALRCRRSIMRPWRKGEKKRDVSWPRWPN